MAHIFSMEAQSSLSQGSDRMKSVAVVCLGLLALASASPMIDLDVDTKVVTMDIKDKQVVILKLLNNVLQPIMYKDLEEIGFTYKIEDNLDKYVKTEVIKEFLMLFKVGTLPRGEVFTLHVERQMNEVIKMFHVLYYAKDFATFLKTACWMRVRMNEGMFVYALTVAIRHRDDCKGIVLPAPYEIYPYFFLRADVIQKAYLLKMKRGLLDEKLCDFYGIRKTEKDIYIIDENVYDTRVLLNDEDRLRYFTEDIDLNTYYYYFHVDFPFWMRDDILDKTTTRRWELTFYMYQQILARYYMERLSNDMGEIPNLSWNRQVKSGYWPWMKMHNGVEVGFRYNDYIIVKDYNLDIVRLVETYETIIKEAILKGFVEIDGFRLELTKPEDVEILGKIVYGKIDKKELEKTNVEAYRYLLILMKAVLGLNTFTSDKYFVVPTVLDQYQTALRDPIFYQIQKRLIDFLILFKNRLPVYTREELIFPGVKVENVVVDKLVTYFDDYLMDMTNAVTFTNEELKKTIPDMSFFAKKRRLNNQPFKVKIDVSSDKTVDCLVKLFLGPKYDHMGKLIDINENRFNFVEIDAFIRKLDTGKNTIVRDSLDMHNIIQDRIMTRDFARKIDTMTDVNELLKKDLLNYNTGFPYRLLLPKGKVGGLKMMLYVIVTPLRLRDNVDRNVLVFDGKNVCRNCRFTAVLDKMPLGFPLDRRIDLTKFWTPNMKVVDVVVFHKKTVCDMKTRWERYVLKGYNVNDKTVNVNDGTFFLDTQVDRNSFVDRNTFVDKRRIDDDIDTMLDL